LGLSPSVRNRATPSGWGSGVCGPPFFHIRPKVGPGRGLLWDFACWSHGTSLLFGIWTFQAVGNAGSYRTRDAGRRSHLLSGGAPSFLFFLLAGLLDNPFFRMPVWLPFLRCGFLNRQIRRSRGRNYPWLCEHSARRPGNGSAQRIVRWHARPFSRMDAYDVSRPGAASFVATPFRVPRNTTKLSHGCSTGVLVDRDPVFIFVLKQSDHGFWESYMHVLMPIKHYPDKLIPPPIVTIHSYQLRGACAPFFEGSVRLGPNRCCRWALRMG